MVTEVNLLVFCRPIVLDACEVDIGFTSRIFSTSDENCDANSATDLIAKDVPAFASSPISRSSGIALQVEVVNAIEVAFKQFPKSIERDALNKAAVCNKTDHPVAPV
jgi:hypothetical protein